MREVRHRKKIEVHQNIVDRAVNFFSPRRGAQRLRARYAMALAGAYHGASKKRRSLSEWNPSAGDADTDIIAELPDLRERSRDLIRNNPLACGAINTKCTSVVGTGLKLKSRIDRNILNLTEDQADAWESRTEAEWKLWADSFDCDVSGAQNFAGIQDLSFHTTLENGDGFVLTPSTSNKFRAYNLQLQLIEADRVCNKDSDPDTEFLAGGILKDANGRPKQYHILKGHPGNIYSKQNQWAMVPAYGAATGRKNVLHLFRKLRIGQSRGVPDLAPVIETLKQLGRYTDAEVDASVISAFFTVFIKSEYHAGMYPMQPTTEIGGSTADKDYKMGSGAILDLLPNESIETANPGRPNQAFDAFVLAVSRQIGVALELPFEILVKHFTASYSAARAALLEAWRFYMGRRKWLEDVLCRPVYELWMTEAVARGRIAAPGFLTGDPLIKMAYLGSEWTGPSKGQIDELKEVNAAKERLALTLTTHSEETAALTGGDWEQKFPQRAKEERMKKDAGMGAENQRSEVGGQRSEKEKSGSDLEDETKEKA